MCGIAGIIQSRAAKADTKERLLPMMAALKHRGPDESGLYLDDRAALGHTRLSIIDLSSGTQPIHNEDESLWIVFNGEIFNYPELRAELIAKGHRFYTATDTETILHLYEEKGAACLNDLNGQFAFAVWDTRNKSCFLARDRVGIRPLYFTEKDGELIFASEIKAVFMNDDVKREIDPVAMDQIFTFWSPLPGHTVFKNIRELPAGHCLMFQNGRSAITRYWDLPFTPGTEKTNDSPEQICEQIRSLLLEATRIRLRADVPVGTYLSGGLDSSGITALVAQHFNHNVKSFGIRFDETEYDEGVYQREAASFLGVDHTEHCVSNRKIGAALPEVIWHSETPLLRTAPVPLYLLSKTVREHNLKVVLTGEGSDEVFGGYNIFREAAVRRFWAEFPESQKRADLIAHLYPYLFKHQKMKRMTQAFFARGLDRTDDPLFSHLLRWENTSRLKAYFSDELKSSIGSYSGYDEVRDALPDGFHTWDHLSQAQHLETTLFMSCYLLSSQGDRMAMGHSVEIRLPYLDPNVMEYMGRVPAVWKILGLKEKYILKKAFCGTLPDSIALRPKHPYRAPVSGSLLNSGLQERTRVMLSEASLRQSGLFDPKRVNRLLQNTAGAAQVSEINGMALTGILTAQILYDRFIQNFSAPTETLAPQITVDRRNVKGENNDG